MFSMFQVLLAHVDYEQFNCKKRVGLCGTRSAYSFIFL